jgi:hypothetical protein
MKPKLLFFQVICLLVVILVSLYHYEKFSSMESNIFTSDALMTIAENNYKIYNRPCSLPTTDNKGFKFTYKYKDSVQPYWYSSNEPLTCGIEVSGEDIGNDVTNCSKNNTNIYDPEIVDDVYMNDANIDIKRCQVRFKPKLTTEGLTNYIQKQSGYKQKAKLPIDCKVSNWGEWSKCDKECGGGVQFRNRNVKVMSLNGGIPCPPLMDTRECNTKSCPVDCKVTSWGEWSNCNKPCGGGQSTRTRTVTTQPQYGGIPCPSLSEVQDCNTNPCPVNCSVSDWSSWSPCTAKCGGGTQTRTRIVTRQASYGGNPCPILTESQNCNTQQCGVDCEVTDWSDWSACDKECGGGSQKRTRSVTKQPSNGGQGCPSLTEIQECNKQECKQDSGMEKKSTIRLLHPLASSYMGTDVYSNRRAEASIRADEYGNGTLIMMVGNDKYDATLVNAASDRIQVNINKKNGQNFSGTGSIHILDPVKYGGLQVNFNIGVCNFDAR